MLRVHVIGGILWLMLVNPLLNQNLKKSFKPKNRKGDKKNWDQDNLQS